MVVGEPIFILNSWLVLRNNFFGVPAWVGLFSVFEFRLKTVPCSSNLFTHEWNIFFRGTFLYPKCIPKSLWTLTNDPNLKYFSTAQVFRKLTKPLWFHYPLISSVSAVIPEKIVNLDQCYKISLLLCIFLNTL